MLATHRPQKPHTNKKDSPARWVARHVVLCWRGRRWGPECGRRRWGCWRWWRPAWRMGAWCKPRTLWTERKRPAMEQRRERERERLKSEVKKNLERFKMEPRLVCVILLHHHWRKCEDAFTYAVFHLFEIKLPICADENTKIERDQKRVCEWCRLSSVTVRKSLNSELTWLQEVNQTTALSLGINWARRNLNKKWR